MDTAVAVDSLELAGFAGGFIGIGVGLGLTIYHFGLGWFISRTSKESLGLAVESAERHLIRRAQRRHGRERRARILAEHGAGGGGAPSGRHLRQ